MSGKLDFIKKDNVLGKNNIIKTVRMQPRLRKALQHTVCLAALHTQGALRHKMQNTQQHPRQATAKRLENIPIKTWKGHKASTNKLNFICHQRNAKENPQRWRSTLMMKAAWKEGQTAQALARMSRCTFPYCQWEGHRNYTRCSFSQGTVEQIPSVPEGHREPHTHAHSSITPVHPPLTSVLCTTTQCNTITQKGKWGTDTNSNMHRPEDTMLKEDSRCASVYMECLQHLHPQEAETRGWQRAEVRRVSRCTED